MVLKNTKNNKNLQIFGRANSSITNSKLNTNVKATQSILGGCLVFDEKT
jgi:hypothetical protein